ncbi:MAG: type VI secretion system ATPase TssH, partial [Desulfobulbaceae bacterium]|nr:type VI secretion system ATPase TssH [Desulfobulbaceae bacterium]
FHSLTREDLAKIVDIQLGLLKQRLMDQHYHLDITGAAKEFLVRVGYEPAFGARPLKRAIQRYLQDALAMTILEGRFIEGDDIVVDLATDGQGLNFNKRW